MLQGLAEKVVLITGAAGGIGAATARRFAQEGAIVLAADIDDQAGTRLLAELGEPHRYIHLDVADYAAWEQALARELEAPGGLDVLFLNAGVTLRGRGTPNNDDPFDWLSKERTDRVLDVVLHGSLNGLLAAIPHLRARGGGHVIVLGQLPVLAADPVYTMAKHALVALTRAIGPTAARHGITVIGVQPSGVDTPIVSPNVRAADVPLNPPSRVAEDLITILERARPGEFWLISPAGNPDPPSRYDFPPLPGLITQTAERTNAMFATATGIPPLKH